MNILKCLFSFLLVLSIISCKSIAEEPNSFQGKDSNLVNNQINLDSFQADNSSSTFAKTFIVNGVYDDSSNRIVYTENLVEFRHDSNEISVVVDNKEKSSLKFETSYTKFRADFRDDVNTRYFILILGSAASGTCGDSIFAIVKIDQNLEAKISQPNKADCQGELYKVSIETVSTKKDFFRQIIIGDLKFNLENFDWIKHM